LWVAVSYGCLGGHFSIFSYAVTNIFGMHSGGILYSILYSAYALSSLSGYFVSTYLVKEIGIKAFFFIGTGLTALSGLLLFFFNPSPLVKDDNFEDASKK
jgi:Na+/melibiose symporter-like transporter